MSQARCLCATLLNRDRDVVFLPANGIDGLIAGFGRSIPAIPSQRLHTPPDPASVDGAQAKFAGRSLPRHPDRLAFGELLRQFSHVLCSERWSRRGGIEPPTTCLHLKVCRMLDPHRLPVLRGLKSQGAKGRPRVAHRNDVTLVIVRAVNSKRFDLTSVRPCASAVVGKTGTRVETHNTISEATSLALNALEPIAAINN